MPAPPAQRRSQSVRLFGYDLFISFALGPPPRGSRSYASDLARKLRELDFAVFFSEDEAPVGAELDQTLRSALRRSRVLVVVANRATLAEPRWVRSEVEEFRRLHPGRPVVPISIDGALQDPAVVEQVEPWLPCRDRIWIDETRAAAELGAASDEVVARLATAPRALRSSVRWRGLVGTVLVFFAALAAFSSLMGVRAERSARAEAAAAVEARSAEGRASEAAAREARAASAARAAEAVASSAAVREAEAASAARAAQREAERQRDIAVARQMGAQAELMRSRQPDRQPLALLMATESLRLQPDAIETQLTLRRLLAATPRPVAVLAQGERVSQVAFDPGGTLVAGAGTPDGRLWSVARRAPVADLPGANRQVVFSPDGRRVAGCCRQVGVWTADGRPELALDAAALQGEPRVVAFSPDGGRLAVALRAGRPGFAVIDLATRQPVLRHRITLSGEADALAWGPDGRLYFGPRDTIQVHAGPDLQLERQLKPGFGGVRRLAVDPRGRFLAASNGRRVVVYDLGRPDDAPVALEAGGSGPGEIETLAFDAGGEHLLAAGTLDTGQVWRRGGWKPVLRVSHQEFQTIGALVVDAATAQALSCAGDGLCAVWSLRSGARVQQLAHVHAHTGRADRREVAGAALHAGAGSLLLATGGNDGSLRLWDLSPPLVGSPRRCINHFRIATYAADATGWRREADRLQPADRGCRAPPGRAEGAREARPDGRFEVVVLPVDQVRIDEAGSGRTVATLVHDFPVDWDAVQARLQAEGLTSLRPLQQAVGMMKTSGSVGVAAVSPSARWVVTHRGADRRLRLWDTASARVVLDEPADAGPPRWMHFVSDAQLLTLAPDGRLSLRVVPDGTTRWTVDAGDAGALALSDDGSLVAWASGRTPARVQVIRVADGGGVLSASTPQAIGELQFTGRGRHLLGLGGPTTVPEGLPIPTGVVVWQLPSGRAVLAPDRAAGVVAVAASADGTRLATLDQGGGLRLWDLASGRVVGETVLEDVGPLAFSRDGAWLAAGRRTVAVLEARTLRPVARLELDGEARALEFADDGRSLVVQRFVDNASVGTQERYAWQRDDLLAEACRRLPADAARQWQQLLGGPSVPRPCRP